MLFNNTFPSISYVQRFLAPLDFYVCSSSSSIAHLLIVLCRSLSELFRLRKFPSASICQSPYGDNIVTSYIIHHVTQSVYIPYVSSISRFFVFVFLDYSLYYTVCTTTTSTKNTSPSMSRPFNLLRNLLLF